jgi:hypothetical protein
METSEKLQSKLQHIILDNKGWRENIYREVLELVNPLVVALEAISEPTGAYSKDPLTHANNTIANVVEIAETALKTLEADKQGTLTFESWVISQNIEQ